MNPSNKEPKLLDHEADGIRELDNNLPRWWVWLFYLTIIFSAAYLAIYHVFNAAPLQAEEYRREQEAGDKIKAQAIERFERDITNLRPSSDVSVLSQGQIQYATLCAPCHRADGGGLVGPNLCDDYWVHGSNYVDTVRIIMNGVPEKGMLTWRGILKPAEIQAVASFIHTLRGSNPPNPKPREDQAPAAPAFNFE